jgi:DNA adenine methylase
MSKVPGPVGWFGGKGRALTWLLPRLPQGKVYVEPFGGAATVILNASPAPCMVYNDLDKRLVNLMRVFQEPELYDELAHRLLHTLYSRAESDSAVKTLKAYEPEPDKPSVEYAWAFFVAQNQGYSGKGTSEGSWGKAFVSRQNMAATCSQWLSRIELLPEWHKRLRKIQIDCCDGIRCIKYWDSKDTAFYLDPPYPHETRTYSKDYALEQPIEFHAELVDVLLAIEGQATLSCYWHEVYQPLLDHGWQRLDVEVLAYSASRARGCKTRDKSPARTETLLLKHNKSQTLF